MEVKSPAWLDKNHPNFERWERARQLSDERGKFVEELVSTKVSRQSLSILDLGSGEGGTSNIFSENNTVISFDISLIRLIRQNEFYPSANFSKVNGSGKFLPFKNSTFDLIILQDVIEHVYEIDLLLEEINRVLKVQGKIFLSTPNKYSIINLISDPHWGMPLISLLKRDTIRKYFLALFRKKEIERTDIPQLSSLNDVIRLFKNYDISLNTNFAVEKLLEGHKGIVWSNFHLFILKILTITRLSNFIKIISNDSFGIVNKYFTPTYYFFLNKN